MDRVLDRLWIGSAEDFRQPLATLGFTGIVDLRDGQVAALQEGLVVWRIDQRDGDPWKVEQVKGALTFIGERIATGSVLVACTAGMSRSACMVIGYLVQTGWGLAEALERVRAARPKIMPVAKMLESVLQAVQP